VFKGLSESHAATRRRQGLAGLGGLAQLIGIFAGFREAHDWVVSDRKLPVLAIHHDAQEPALGGALLVTLSRDANAQPQAVAVDEHAGLFRLLHGPRREPVPTASHGDAFV
jgi:hypothetical protein